MRASNLPSCWARARPDCSKRASRNEGSSLTRALRRSQASLPSSGPKCACEARCNAARNLTTFCARICSTCSTFLLFSTMIACSCRACYAFAVIALLDSVFVLYCYTETPTFHCSDGFLLLCPTSPCLIVVGFRLSVKKFVRLIDIEEVSTIDLPGSILFY